MVKRVNNLFASVADRQNLKLDVRKYFDSIDHRILMRQISRLIKDEHVLFLVHGIINSYSTSEGRGLPIGNLTSQYFANHNGLWIVKAQGPGFICQSHEFNH